MKKPKYLSDYMEEGKGFPNDESATFKDNPLDSIKWAKKQLQKQREINKHILHLASIWHNSKNN